MKKKCSACRLEKSVEEFYKNKNRGYQTYCKKCSSAKRAQWSRDNVDKTRSYRLKYRYGLTEDKVQEMLESQEYKCGLCDKPLDISKQICIDHDHKCCPGNVKSCGKCVRSILHTGCNSMLGWFENKSNFVLFQKYIDKHKIS